MVPKFSKPFIFPCLKNPFSFLKQRKIHSEGREVEVSGDHREMVQLARGPGVSKGGVSFCFLVRSHLFDIRISGSVKLMVSS